MAKHQGSGRRETAIPGSAQGTSVRTSADGRRKRVLIGLGLLAAAGLAVAGGMALGEYASVPGSRSDESSTPLPRTTRPTESPAPPAVPAVDRPREILPQVAVATRVAPESGRIAINPDSWVRQQHMPRQMYGNQDVSGTVVAYLTVAGDGDVTGCTIGGNSRVTPARMLNASATGVCRALLANARFEPLTETPMAPKESGVDEAQAQDDIRQPVPDTDQPDAPETHTPRNAQVMVQVAFRTGRSQARTASPE